MRCRARRTESGRPASNIRFSTATPMAGSVSGRASKYSRFDEGEIFRFSGGFQDTQDRCGAAKEVEPAVVGGDLLIGFGAGTEEVA